MINPVLVLGPILTEAYGSSAQLFLNVFQNKNEKVANYPVFCCDVRDVALAVNYLPCKLTLIKSVLLLIKIIACKSSIFT